MNKKLLKTRKLYEEEKTNYDCVDGVIDELKKAKHRLVYFLKMLQQISNLKKLENNYLKLFWKQ